MGAHGLAHGAGDGRIVVVGRKIGQQRPNIGMLALDLAQQVLAHGHVAHAAAAQVVGGALVEAAPGVGAGG